MFAGGDTNLYGYVLADPINLIDPSGLSWETFWQRTTSNFNQTNAALGDAGRKVLTLGASATGAVAQSVGGLGALQFLAGKQPLAPPIAGPGFNLGSRAIIAGSTSLINSALVLGAFQVGVGIGSAAGALGEEIGDWWSGGNSCPAR